ncbi:MAG: lysophospholipid acyltransferase family protein [Candidatus Gastranaerophilales bacterium]|nr:lysophospholipid acyltransferase family protein [Candidatus Gastranaerophilales bacterium]
MSWVKFKEEKNYAKRYANEYHFLRILFQVFVVYIMSYPFLKLVYNVKAEGRENIPENGRHIFAGNHVSMFDPVWLSGSVCKPIAYMAKKELFVDDCNLSWWIKRLGAFAVDRQKPEIATFKTVQEIFKAPAWSLGIFPQGGIKDNKKIENIQKGFAVIAKHAKADIIPVSIIGFEGYTKKPFSQNVRVKINKPISYKLPVEEIIRLWTEQICNDTGFENGMVQITEEKPVAISI